MPRSSDNNAKQSYLDDEYVKYVPPDDDTVCNICMAEFIDPEDLELHLHQVHSVYKGKLDSCQFCSEPYSDLMAYAVHIRDEHITNMKRCQYCFKAFVNVDNLEKHENKHRRGQNKRVHCCSQCTCTFGSTHELNLHEVGQHNNNIDGVVLNDYLPYLSAALNIKVSTFLQYLGTNTVYICVGCDFTTDNVELFIQHAQNNTCKTYVCNKCSNVYRTKGLMRRHFSKECGNQFRTRVLKMCPDCGGSFNLEQFKKHKKACNSIQCYICQIKFTSMYELSDHQSKEHPMSIEVKSCKFCGKQAVGTVALQKHIDRSHKHELHMYKYLCVYCNNAYKHPKKLFGHFFSKHHEINPYTCKICDLEFRPRKKFTIHIKLKHNSEGYVEFDQNYHVFFTDKKSEEPFIPTSIYTVDDVEIEKPETVKKSDSNIKLIDGTSITETEGNVTEIETKKSKKKPIKQKRAIKVKNYVNNIPLCVYSSDDEPLLVVKKRAQTKAHRAPMSNNMSRIRQRRENNKKKFTCSVCKKYCYTYQNYNHHMSLHSKNDAKVCIICSKRFKSKRELTVHVTKKHSSSKLTDTLRNLIQKRQSGTPIVREVSTAEKFKKTIQKVDLGAPEITAKIKPIEAGLSVQKFIENFSPEENRNEPEVSDVTIKLVRGLYKKPLIKVTKFNPTPLSSSCRLSMPKKFKECYTEKATITVKIVQPPPVVEDIETDHNVTDHNEEDEYRNDIPEVAEEVMLDGTEEPPKQVLPTKIFIDNLPKGYKDIRIAHMLPEAPYYKIIKIKDMLENKKDEKVDSDNGVTYRLPHGKKLVSSNPLAHLLGETAVDKVVEASKSKYYKPKAKNFEGLLVKALAKLEQPTPPKRKKQKVAFVDKSEVCYADDLITEDNMDALAEENIEVLPTEENIEVLPTEESIEVLTTEGNMEALTTEENMDVLATEDNMEVLTTEDNMEVSTTEGNMEVSTTEGNMEVLTEENVPMEETQEVQMVETREVPKVVTRVEPVRQFRKIPILLMRRGTGKKDKNKCGESLPIIT